jgi:single-strand DNA-binding protein
MNDLNSVTLIGRLTHDPELKYTNNGSMVCKIQLANNETYTQNNEKKENVNYFSCYAWGKTAEICDKYLKKGVQVAIQGKLKYDSWTDKNGQKASRVSVTISNIQFLTKNTTSDQKNAASTQNSQQNNSYVDDIPF